MKSTLDGKRFTFFLLICAALLVAPPRTGAQPAFQLVKTIPLTQTVHDLAVTDNYAYVTESDADVKIIDLSTGANRQLPTGNVGHWPYAKILGNRLAISLGQRGVTFLILPIEFCQRQWANMHPARILWASN